MITRVARRLARARAESGLRGLVSETAYLARTAAALPAVTLAEAAFDRRRGIRTRGRLRHEAALAPLALGGDPVHYEPADRRSWKKVTSTIPIERGAATFVDLGCGLGRAVIPGGGGGVRSRHRRGTGRAPGRGSRGERPSMAVPTPDHDGSRRTGRRDRAGRRGDVPPGRRSLGHLALQPVRRHDAETGAAPVVRRGSVPEAPVFIAFVYPVHLGVFDEFPRMVPHSRGGGWHVYRLAPTSPDGTRSGPGTPSTGASPAPSARE